MTWTSLYCHWLCWQPVNFNLIQIHTEAYIFFLFYHLLTCSHPYGGFVSPPSSLSPCITSHAGGFDCTEISQFKFPQLKDLNIKNTLCVLIISFSSLSLSCIWRLSELLCVTSPCSLCGHTSSLALFLVFLSYFCPHPSLNLHLPAFTPSSPLLLHFPWHSTLPPPTKQLPLFSFPLSVSPTASHFASIHRSVCSDEIYGRLRDKCEQRWRWLQGEESTYYSIRDFALERAREESVVFPPLSLSPSLSLLPLCTSMCVGVCVSRLSRLRCCSLPPQMSWEEEGKRMYLARGKQEEFGSGRETNQRLG